MKNPDKYIRQGISVAINSLYQVVDYTVGSDVYQPSYIIISTQTKQQGITSKCGNQWDCSVLLDLVTRFDGYGNPGDRVPLNDMEEKVMERMQEFTIQGGFTIFSIELESSTSLDSYSDTMNVFRQLMRYRIVLNQIEAS